MDQNFGKRTNLRGGYSVRRKLKQKPRCTCNSRDLERGEHYITCPVVLTTEVLALLGLERKVKRGKRKT